jgi:hypothetical protein
MPNTGLVRESKAFLSAYLRNLELKGAGSDEERLREIGATSDEMLLKKWLWRATIVGAPAFFIAIPLFLWILSFIFTPFIMEIFWFFDQFGMFLVILIFGSAVYLTATTKKEGDN